MWYRRNKLRVEKPCLPVQRIVKSASLFLQEFRPKKKKPPTVPRQRNAQGWLSGKPWLLILLKQIFMVLFSQKLMKLGMLVAQRAVTFIRELGLNNSIFYGDSGVVINLNHVGSSLSSIGHLVKDTLSLIGSLVGFFFSYDRLQGNIVNHILFARVRYSFPLLVWIWSIFLQTFLILLFLTFLEVNKS